MDSILTFSHQLLEQHIKPDDIVIDATCGNGHDSLFLAQLLRKEGKLYAIDIQEQAIQTTHQRLKGHRLEAEFELLHMGHEEIDAYFPKDLQIGGAIFNLGYLPQSDKSIITQPQTTLAAFDGILKRLRKGGIMVVVIYHGHPGGQEEKEAVVDYLSQLDQQDFQVLRYEFINQKNKPPFILAVEKQ